MSASEIYCVLRLDGLIQSSVCRWVYRSSLDFRQTSVLPYIVPAKWLGYNLCALALAGARTSRAIAPASAEIINSVFLFRRRQAVLSLLLHRNNPCGVDLHF